MFGYRMGKLCEFSQHRHCLALSGFDISEKGYMQDLCILMHEYENPKTDLNLGGYSGYEAYDTHREKGDQAYEKDQKMACIGYLYN